MPGSAAMRSATALRSSDRRQVDEREGSERAVMHDVRIGDRQDHPRLAFAEPGIEVSCR